MAMLLVTLGMIKGVQAASDAVGLGRAPNPMFASNLSEDSLATVKSISMVLESDPQKQAVSVRWRFTMAFAADAIPTSIEIVDQDQKPEAIVLMDADPKVTQGQWSSQSRGQVLGASLLESMRAKEPWKHIYRVQVAYLDGKTSTFYRPVVYQQSLRLMLLEAAQSMLEPDASSTTSVQSPQ